MRALSFIPARCNCIKQNIFSKFIFKNSKHHGVSPCILFLATFFFSQKDSDSKTKVKEATWPPPDVSQLRNLSLLHPSVFILNPPIPSNLSLSLSWCQLCQLNYLNLYQPPSTQVYVSAVSFCAKLLRYLTQENKSTLATANQSNLSRPSGDPYTVFPNSPSDQETPTGSPWRLKLAYSHGAADTIHTRAPYLDPDT